MRRVVLVVVLMIGVVLANVTEAWSQALDRRVTIVNAAGTDIVGVYASTRSSSSWGSNRLPKSLNPGYEITLDLADGSGSCNLDVMIVRSERRRMTGLYDVCSTRRIVVDSSNANNLEVQFVNRTPESIRYLYVGGTNWWSEDLLGPGVSLVSDAAHTRVVKSPSGCRFNVRAVYWDQSDLVIENADLCATPTLEISRPKR